MRVLILGSTGMLGSTMFRYLAKQTGIDVLGTFRNPKKKNFLIKYCRKISNTNFFVLKKLHFKKIEKIIQNTEPDFVINCLGAIKQKKIKNSEMLKINSLLPKKLFKLCGLLDFKLIHISTDCVFSGARGNYDENDRADAMDIYGRSKFLGEFFGHNCITIRTSIIGHELNTRHSLLEWFLGNRSKKIFGYKNAFFNGFTTLELSRIIYKYFIMKNINFKKNLVHISSKKISKYDLLQIIKKIYNSKITIIPECETKIDRTLNNKFFVNKSNYKFPGWGRIISDMKSFN